MIGHEAVGIHPYPKHLLKFSKVGKITLIVLGSSKHHLTVMTALDNVMRVVR
jgi:hypothetical protein